MIDDLPEILIMSGSYEGNEWFISGLVYPNAPESGRIPAGLQSYKTRLNFDQGLYRS